MTRSITAHILFRTKLTAIVALLAFCAALMIPVNAPAQAPSRAVRGASALVSGPATSSTTNGVFNGVLTITGFALDTATGALTATGNLVGTITGPTGVIGTVNQAITAVVAGASATCSILNLTLGPLDLTLLGLNVHLNQVVLTITATPGAGNLLGNLLCDVANLLNGGNLSSLLQQLVADLNNILAAL